MALGSPTKTRPFAPGFAISSPLALPKLGSAAFPICRLFGQCRSGPLSKRNTGINPAQPARNPRNEVLDFDDIDRLISLVVPRIWFLFITAAFSSFRLRLSADAPAVRLAGPLVGRAGDFNPQVDAPFRAPQKTGGCFQPPVQPQKKLRLMRCADGGRQRALSGCLQEAPKWKARGWQ